LNARVKIEKMVNRAFDGTVEFDILGFLRRQEKDKKKRVKHWKPRLIFFDFEPL
jgi:hypothetical protein